MSGSRAHGVAARAHAHFRFEMLGLKACGLLFYGEMRFST